MTKKYNKERHLELLERRSLDILSRDEFFELRDCFSILLWQTDWKVRNEYLQILKDFQNGKLNNIDFCKTFLKRAKINQDIATILESNLDFVLDSDQKKLEKFGKLINSTVIHCICHDSDGDFSSENDKIAFQHTMEETYLQIQTYLDEKPEYLISKKIFEIRYSNNLSLAKQHS